MDELRRRFDRPGLAPLWQALRARYEHAGDAPVRRVTVDGLDGEQQRALAELLGWDRLPGARATVAVARLDRVIGEAVPGGCARAVIEALGGPVADRAGARSRARADREALWAWLAEHPQVRAEPALQPWVAEVRRAGVIGGDVARTRALLEQALAVLGALPADGRPRASFAAQVCGDPHALDDGTRLAGVVLRAVATLRGTAVPDDGEARRALWAQVGVACDELSTAVLVAGLRPAGGGPLAATLATWAECGQAAWVTLAQLDADAPVALTEPVCWAVENPSVVAEALGRFGAGCPPIVCTSGWPTSAALALLRAIEAGGTRLRYHGDLDGEGVRIAAHLASRVGVEVWAMSALDYLDHARDDSPPVGRITDAPWDPALAAAMGDHGVAVPQEETCAELLGAMAGQ